MRGVFISCQGTTLASCQGGFNFLLRFKVERIQYTPLGVILAVRIASCMARGRIYSHLRVSRGPFENISSCRGVCGASGISVGQGWQGDSLSYIFDRRILCRLCIHWPPWQTMHELAQFCASWPRIREIIVIKGSKLPNCDCQKWPRTPPEQVVPKTLFGNWHPLCFRGKST